MPKFLHTKFDDRTDEKFLQTVSKSLEDGIQNDIAVAYWGTGATKKLGLANKKPTRVICDLLSGGCNPTEIRELQSSVKSADDVRCLGGLHAKVYITDKSVIVGSANASTNGLGGEGEIGTFEAAIETDDEIIVAQAKTWFDKIWEISGKITAAELDQAEEAWKGRRGPIMPGETVVQKLLSDPNWFQRKVFVTNYFTEASEEAIRKFDEIKHEYYSPHELKMFVKDNYPVYDENIKDVPSSMIGSFVIAAADQGEVYTILKIENYSVTKCAVLLKPEKSLMGLAFPKQQRTWMKNAIKKHLNGAEEDKAWNLERLPDDVVHYLQQKFSASKRDV